MKGLLGSGYDAVRERLATAEPFAMKKSSAGLIRRERDAA